MIHATAGSRFGRRFHLAYLARPPSDLVQAVKSNENTSLSRFIGLSKAVDQLAGFNWIIQSGLNTVQAVAKPFSSSNAVEWND